MEKNIGNKYLEKLQKRSLLKCDLLEVNRKMSKSNANLDEYPMRYIMKVVRNLSSSTRKRYRKAVKI